MKVIASNNTEFIVVDGVNYIVVKDSEGKQIAFEAEDGK